MEKGAKGPHIQSSGEGEGEDTEPVEVVLWQVSECYVLHSESFICFEVNQ